MRSHSVACHPSQVNTPGLNPCQRPVLDLPTRKGGQAELTWATGYIPRWFTRTQTITHQSTSARPGRESNSRPIDHKSDALTTTPPNHRWFGLCCVDIVDGNRRSILLLFIALSRYKQRQRRAKRHLPSTTDLSASGDPKRTVSTSSSTSDDSYMVSRKTLPTNNVASKTNRKYQA